MEMSRLLRRARGPADGDPAEIKKAFRKLAREHHPDMKPGDKAAEQRFKDINEANEVLSDPEKRAKYDRFGADWEASARPVRSRRPDPFGPGGPFATRRTVRGGYTDLGRLRRQRPLRVPTRRRRR